MDHGAANPRLKQLEGLTRLKALCDAGVVSLGAFEQNTRRGAVYARPHCPPPTA